MLIGGIGIAKSEQLLVHGRCGCWIEHRPVVTVEADQRAIEPKDQFAQGGIGQDIGLDQEFFQLQGHVENHQPALCPILWYVDPR